MPQLRNGNEITIQLPTSIAAIATAIGKLGPITAIACYLVYVGARKIPEMSDNILLLRTAQEESNKLSRQEIAEHEKIHQSIIKTCIVNAIKNQVDISKCYDDLPAQR